MGEIRPVDMGAAVRKELDKVAKEKRTVIDFRSKGIKEIPGDELAKCELVQRINVSGNKLKTLPPEIGNLAALQRLNLFANQLEVLPQEIRKLDIAANPWIDEVKEPAKKGPDYLLNFLRSEEYDAIYFRWMQEQAKKEGN